MKHSVIFAAMGFAAFGVAAQETGTVISSTPVVQQVAVCGQGVPTCTTPASYENRTVGYNVTYEFNGRRYQAQLPMDPGPTIRLRVTPVGEVRPMMRMYRGPAMGTGPVTAPPVQYAQRQQPMQQQQPMQMQQPMQQQHMQQQPMQHQQMHPQMQHMQPMPAPDTARNYGEAVPPEQERQGTNTSATESGNAVMFGYGNPYGYGYGYPAHPGYGYGYPAHPGYGYGYGYGYPAVYGAAVLPVYRPFYRPWVGYRPWGGYYRPWGYGPRVSVGFGWRGGWR